MKKTVPFKHGTWNIVFRTRQVIGARRASIPGMPWFKCFTNKWFSARFQCQRFNLTEAGTGLIPYGGASGCREIAIEAAHSRLIRLKRPAILAAIHRVKAGHFDRLRIPQNFRFRTR